MKPKKKNWPSPTVQETDILSDLVVCLLGLSVWFIVPRVVQSSVVYLKIVKMCETEMT